jgi:hypothetical protein
MSQSTYGNHDDWFHSPLSYDERETALFGSSCLMSQATYREHDVRSTMSYQERETALLGDHTVLLYPGSHIQSNLLVTNGVTMCSRS